MLAQPAQLTRSVKRFLLANIDMLWILRSIADAPAGLAGPCQGASAAP